MQHDAMGVAIMPCRVWVIHPFDDELDNAEVTRQCSLMQWSLPILNCRVWVLHPFDDELDNVQVSIP